MMSSNPKQFKFSQWCTLSLLAMTTLVSVAQAQYGHHRREREVVTYSCMLRDNFDSSYIGHGNSKLDAQADAATQCQKQRDAMFCQNEQNCEASVMIEREGGEYEPVTNLSCVLQDNFGTTYVGHGATQIDAVADASAQCEKSRDAMFCKNEPQCEAIRR